MHKIILLTGISGAGKSVALNLLEDTGFTCVDNLPVRFLEEFLDHALNKGVERVAVAIDARTPDDLNDLPNVLHRLRELGLALRVIFLDASDHTLKQRYSESRRRHPLTDRRKSTRLNSSHVAISYAVFCLKKKNKPRRRTR